MDTLDRDKSYEQFIANKNPWGIPPGPSYRSSLQMMPVLLPIAADTMGPSESTPPVLLVTKAVCSVAQSGPTLCKSVDCSPLGSPVHGDLQAGILGWVAVPSSRGSS